MTKVSNILFVIVVLFSVFKGVGVATDTAYTVHLPIVRVASSLGYTATQHEHEVCYLLNYATNVVQIFVSDRNSWCEYRLTVGLQYRVSIIRDGQYVHKTFIAEPVSQEYTPEE